MPLKEFTQRPLPRRQDLLDALVSEWRKPHAQAGDEYPTILVQEAHAAGTRYVYVVWKEWALITQRDRSELIMDACEQVKGTDWALRVIVAMGLTPEEAQRMRLEV
jgi:hypothetical protein